MTFNLWYEPQPMHKNIFYFEKSSLWKIQDDKRFSSNEDKNSQNSKVSKFILERNYKTQLDWNVVELKKLLSTTYVDTSYLTKKNCICLSAINPITLKGFDQVILESLFVGSYIKINSKIGYGKAISWLT